MKIKIEPLSDKWPSEKLMINNWLVYVKSIYFNGKYRYYSQVLFTFGKSILYRVLKMIINSKKLISKLLPTIIGMI